MRLAVVMDPLDTVHPDEDTSFLLMLAAQERGHQIVHVAAGAPEVEDGRCVLPGRAITARRDRRSLFAVGPARRWRDDEIDLVLVRSDPPFDDAYLRDTQVLDLLPWRVPVINAGEGLRAANEKLFACRFPDLCPPTCITADLARFRAFLAEHGEVVIKPLDGYRGRGVFRLRTGDANVAVAFEALSGRGARPVVVQRFLPSEGEKRLLLLDGAILGCLWRIADDHDPDHRHPEISLRLPEIDAADRAIVAGLAPDLARLGLVFVGLDVIAGRLIEVNVTSPTCLQEWCRLSGRRDDLAVIAACEAHAAARR